LDVTSTIDAFVSSSEARTEEEVTHPIDQDRAKTTAWKGKGKEDLSSQSRSSSAMGSIMSTLKKLGTHLLGRRYESSITSSARRTPHTWTPKNW
jgi:hypothetical protein